MMTKILSLINQILLKNKVDLSTYLTK